MNTLNNKKIQIAALIIAILAAIMIIITLIDQNTVKQTKTSVTHEAGKELVLKVEDFFDVDEKKEKQITIDTSAVDVNTVGTYEAVATFKPLFGKQEFTITVTIEDKSVPAVKLSHRYIFTNDISKADLTSIVEGVYDASEYSLKLIRYEKSGILNVLNEKALKNLTDSIPVPADKAELENLGTTDIPTEEGIYRAVLAATDTYGNTQLEELYVIYDTTGAKIEDVPDKEIVVPADKVAEAPKVNAGDYVIIDNVDGKAASEDIKCELTLRDEAKHEWIVKVSYTDRARNNSTADFLITVKADESEQTPTTPDEPGNNDSEETPGTTEKPEQTPSTDKEPEQTPEQKPSTDKKPEQKPEQTPNTPNTSDKEDDKQENNNQNNDNTKYDPADTNKDGVVTPDEQGAYDDEWERACLAAGYNVVVEIEPRKTYMIMTHYGREAQNKGLEILEQYLFEHDLAGDFAKKDADPDRDIVWYMYERCYTSYQNPDNPKYWEENSVYYDEETDLIYESYEDWINGNGI